MMRFKQRHLRELKQLERILWDNYNRQKTYRRIYESSKKKSDKEKVDDINDILIDSPEVLEFIKSASSEIANYLMSKEQGANDLFSGHKTINVYDYFDLLDAIYNLLDKMEKLI